jgi:uncharacterized protein
MLSFDIRSLESKAAQVDANLSPDDPVWEEGDPRADGPIHVTGRLSAAGAGRFYFSGRMEGEVTRECRRCLIDVPRTVREDAHFIFAAEGEVGADDPDVYVFEPNARSLDIRPAVREAWLLAAPQFVLCRENCEGLCATCGADLNEGACECRA